MNAPAVCLERLDNGLRLLLCPAQLAPVAEVQIWADVGAADEGADEAGLAHFHEHMLFKGTGRRGLGEISGEIEGAGGRINAHTSHDVTVYHATLPAAEVALGIDVLADAVTDSVFDAVEISREIEVVLEEIRSSEDSPGSVVGNALCAAAYHRHPYRAPILGTPKSVASIDRNRVQRFFEHWYTPDRLCVVVAGDFDPDAVRDQVRTSLGSLPAGTTRRKRPKESRQDGLRTVVLARPFERVTVELATPAVGLGHPDTPLLDLVAYTLGNGDSSRLVRAVREREGLADRIDASCYTPLDPGLFTLGFETDADRALPALEAAVRELERIRVEPVSIDELEKARANFLAAEDFERESVSGMAQKVGSFLHLAGDVAAEERYLDGVRNATPADLHRVAREHLAPERLTVAAVVPEASSDCLDAERIHRSIEAGTRRIARAFALPVVRTSGPDVVSYDLPSGGRLHVVPRRSIPVVAVRAAFLGGLLADTAETSGLTAFLASMWTRGSCGRSAEDFARATETLAAEIDGFCGRSSLGLTLEAPSAQLPRTIDLFCEALLDPAFDGVEIERERRETLAAIARREDQPAHRAFLLFAQTLYPDHPYGRPLFGRRETVEHFDEEALARQHRRLVQGANLSLAVAGDVEPDAVAQHFSVRLTDLSAGPFEKPAAGNGARPDAIRRAELRKDRAQAHTVIGFPGVAVDDPDRFALEVLAQLLGGQGGRLFLALRERQGLAYSVGAASIEGVAPGWFVVSIATAPEKLERARRGMLDELRRLVDEPPPEAELDATRRYLIGNFAIDRQRNAVHAAQVSLDALYGLGATASACYPDEIAAISRKDVLRVAQRIVDLEAYVEAVVRP
ncbi:MAG: pitrilysin family protein [Myxococcota bacterium]|nr:insulinase family protein [bacterium]MDP6075470.1 pitrilysin family protein [Myxococcota bacterium]MDP6244250.1 pitrilysin family protein [Myxococcota bacterium]MDP7075918.1 pitrilysin family protein [Myxococcota bacterium]MDP7300220.1 pitrilysin family protein [Myxococcota bacterium]